jgi:type VI secretion system secreted protein Hcp
LPARTPLVALCGALVLLALPVAAHAATEMYLSIPGLPGDSRVRGHEDEIVINSFDIGATADNSFRPGGSASGRSTFSELTMTKPIDRATPFLLSRVGTQNRVAQAILSVNKAGPSLQEYMRFCLTGVRVTKDSQAIGPGEGMPSEVIGLSYDAIVETVGDVTGSGTPLSWTSGFDVRNNLRTTSCGSSPGT